MGVWLNSVYCMHCWVITWIPQTHAPCMVDLPSYAWWYWWSGICGLHIYDDIFYMFIIGQRNHRQSRHGQTTDPVQLSLCLSHKRRLTSNADMGFYCVNIMTTSFSSPERIVWTIMSGIITVTRLMSSLGINDHWVKWIYLWFIHTLYAKRTRWNYMYIYFIAKKRKFLKVDRGIYFKSCVLKLTDITKQN